MSLEALLLALLHLPVDANDVTGVERGDRLAEELGLDVLDGATTHNGLQESGYRRKWKRV